MSRDFITWTKQWSAQDDPIALTGVHLKNLQDNITGTVDTALTDDNVHPLAAIQEAKLAYNTTTGHRHTGTDSRLIYTPFEYYRVGLFVEVVDANEFRVTPGTIDADGALLTTTANNSLVLTTAANWIGGTSLESASEFLYVYCFDNAGTLAFRLSDLAPNLTDRKGNTSGFAYFYRLVSGVRYRCLGGAFNDANSNLLVQSEVSFDASNVAVGTTRGVDGTDVTVRTIWTPKLVISNFTSATSPVAGNEIGEFIATKFMLDKLSLNARHRDASAVDGHDWESLTTSAGNVNAITEQAAGIPGSFTLDALASGTYSHWVAMTDNYFYTD